MFTSCGRQVDVRALQRARLDGAEARRSGGALHHGAGREGLRPIGVAELLQTLRVRKIRDGELPELRGAAVGVDRRDDARGIDGHRAQLAGREAVLDDRGDAEVAAVLRRLSPKLKVMFIGGRAVGGREAAEREVAARRCAVTAPVLEKVRVCAAPPPRCR